jgi:hypothetical protein
MMAMRSRTMQQPPNNWDISWWIMFSLIFDMDLFVCAYLFGLYGYLHLLLNLVDIKLCFMGVGRPG